MTVAKTAPTYKRSYPWAASLPKLSEAVTDLENAKKLDPSVVIDEESIKARYIIRKGRVLEDTPSTDDEASTDAEGDSAKSKKSKTTKT